MAALSLSVEAKFVPQTYNVLIRYVPIVTDFDTELDEICEMNGLPRGTIVRMRWIKPVEKRNTTQKYAYAIATLNSIDATNSIISNGLWIRGKKAPAERETKDPTRCMKCQGFDHWAKECKHAHDVCTNCAGKHRTRDCTAPGVRKCANCKTDN
ncbi:hypothetical protein BDN72DRAFT_782662, partial [Pluteus cervinus]